MADDLKVLGLWTSPFVIRVRIMLNLKGLAYEYAEEDLGNKSALLLSSNPVHKTVLVLLHAGRPVNKSQIILQYIDKVWAGTRPTVLRCDPYKHAVTRFWAAKEKLKEIDRLAREQKAEERQKQRGKEPDVEARIEIPEERGLGSMTIIVIVRSALRRMYDDMMNGIIRETKATEEGKDLLDMLLDWMREHWPLAEDDDSRISDTDIAAKECEVDRF
eukprot:XP_008676255.1 glutathione S-transferase U19 [Zea mays]